MANTEWKVKYQIIRMPDSRFCVFFQPEGDIPDFEGQVSVSRKPDHAFYPVKSIHLHNGQGPSFTAYEGAKRLVERVQEDIKAVVAGIKPQEENSLLSRGTVWPAGGAPAGFDGEYAIEPPEGVEVGSEPIFGNKQMGTSVGSEPEDFEAEEIPEEVE